ATQRPRTLDATSAPPDYSSLSFACYRLVSGSTAPTPQFVEEVGEERQASRRSLLRRSVWVQNHGDAFPARRHVIGVKFTQIRNGPLGPDSCLTRHKRTPLDFVSYNHELFGIPVEVEQLTAVSGPNRMCSARGGNPPFPSWSWKRTNVDLNLT